MDRSETTRAGLRFVPDPGLFLPHPNLSDQVNHNIAQSEIEGGVHLDDLSEGTVLEVETQNHKYTIVNGGRGRALIAGHPEFCPEPVAVCIEGSTWGGSMLKVRFIGRGMRLEFQHPRFRTIITSRIIDVRTTASAPVLSRLSHLPPNRQPGVTSSQGPTLQSG